jgi:hypothetical protein
MKIMQEKHGREMYKMRESHERDIQKMMNDLHIVKSQLSNNNSTRNDSATSPDFRNQDRFSQSQTQTQRNSQVHMGQNPDMMMMLAAIDHIMQRPQQSIQVTSVTSDMEIPKFNSKKTTARKYLADVEQYFAAMKYTQDQYLYMINGILPDEIKVWYEFEKPTIHTWKEFKTKFNSRFEDETTKNRRLSELHNKRQELHDATEPFIYEMIELSKLCYPTEPINQTLDRVVMSLYPSIRTIVAASNYSKIEELVKSCQNATNNVVADSRVNKIHTKVPWMTKRPEKDTKFNNNNNKDFDEEYYSNQYNQDYSESNNRNSRPEFYEEEQQAQNYHTGTNQSHYNNRNRNQSNRNDWKRDGFYQTNQPYNNSNNNQSSGNTNKIHNPPSKPEQCSRCFGLGHTEKDCASPMDLQWE